MTEDQLLKDNPWKKVAEMYNPQEKDCLFRNDDIWYVCDEDKNAIIEYNEIIDNAAKSAEDSKKLEILNDKIVTNIPAEPWWGNPLKARLIILSLNPGYVPEVNGKLAKLMQSNDKVRGELINYKAQTLRLEADSFLPQVDDTEPISCRDAVNMLGDWYWYKKLRYLKDDVLSKNKQITEDDFYKRIALIEYHGYSSITSNRTFPRHNSYLKTQIFIRNLIRYLAQREDVCILAMRAIDKWKNLINYESPEEICENHNPTNWYEKYEKEGKIVHKSNKGMSQSITRLNLGEESYDIIKKVIAR